ncbi:MAG: type II toxin-antitoxin system RelE/ParE family toxin [Prevotella sp.]|jgi:proteic killer suppression protein|nr:type II toxin-antitoxin system RelE/ParE family toxin [Prevotella sp.]MCI1281259.1 type II toxin-antitoxin system RelE/ParE family toxin [Prevotella sp.]
MEIEYEKDYLRELYENGKCKNKKFRFQPQIVSKYQKRVDTLMGATRIEDLFVLNSLNFESLEASDKCSIRVDGKYRLEFRTQFKDDEPQITICELTDLTNHYKK